MKKLLISGLGGSLFPYLDKVLNRQFSLFYVDSNPYLKNIYPGLKFFPAPLVTDPEYIPFVKKIVADHGIDVYIPLIDEEILLAIDAFEGRSFPIVMAPDRIFSQICLDKWRLMSELETHGVSTLKTFLASDLPADLKFPVFIKPRTGRGSRGVSRLDCLEQLGAFLLLNPTYKPEELIVQPFIDGQEYTVGVLTNNLNDLICVCAKKVYSKKGITIAAVTENNDTITALCRDIVRKMVPKGPLNIQLFIRPDNRIQIFEINPRFSTTTILSMEAGVHKIPLSIDFFNRSFKGDPVFPKPGVHLYRRWDTVFYEKAD